MFRRILALRPNDLPVVHQLARVRPPRVSAGWWSWVGCALEEADGRASRRAAPATRWDPTLLVPQLLVERREIVRATELYEQARLAPADGEAFSDVHVNALSELYLMQGQYNKVLALIRAAEADAPNPAQFPLDLVAKKGIAQIHLLDVPAATVWQRAQAIADSANRAEHASATF